jgi:hypothetical protein
MKHRSGQRTKRLEAGGREGGAVALHYAGGHPKRVAGLLLADI